jgi:hypothetical protein
MNAYFVKNEIQTNLELGLAAPLEKVRFNKIPKIAILKATGFIGLLIASAFEPKNWEVIRMLHAKRPELLLKGVFDDLFDESTLKSALAQTKPDVALSTA